MRQRALRMTSVALAVAVLFMAIPGVILGIFYLWADTEARMDSRVRSVASVVERLQLSDSHVSPDLLAAMNDSSPVGGSHLSVEYPDGTFLDVGEPNEGSAFSARSVTVQSAVVTMTAPRHVILVPVLLLLTAATVLVAVSYFFGRRVAERKATELSEPLVLLAATAEQIGGGKVRPNIRPSGIEEIDLVYEELSRTADRMAGRISAERQFAADAAHQLRTPLTALSMRLEEIQFLTDDDEVNEEAERALEQIDRLGGVVEELMRVSRSDSAGTTEAISTAEIFDQQCDEWSEVFERSGRDLTFDYSDAGNVLATPGSVSQILATLIENSLKYGAGTTSVTATPKGKMMLIKVRDEGEGVSEELEEKIFTKGISTGGSTGIGLAVAQELAANNGGRLELTQRTPAEFTLTVSAVPQTFDPDRVVPQGALLSFGSRRRRR